jgi:hypothetical protein
MDLETQFFLDFTTHWVSYLVVEGLVDLFLVVIDSDMRRLKVLDVDK